MWRRAVHAHVLAAALAALALDCAGAVGALLDEWTGESADAQVETSSVVQAVGRVGPPLERTSRPPMTKTGTSPAEGTYAQAASPSGGRVLSAKGERPDEIIGFTSQIGGATLAVFSSGDCTYVGQGPRMAVLRAAGSSPPQIVGLTQPLGGLVQGIFVAGDLAYVAAGAGGLRIVDVGNPAAPHELGSCQAPPWVFGSDAACVVANGDYAYVGLVGGGLLVADVTNPAEPSPIATLDPPGVLSGHYYGLATDGDCVYAADWGEPCLRVIDVRDPSAPVQVGYWGAPSSLLDVTLSPGKEYACVAGGLGLHVINITNPAAPWEAGSLAIATPAVAVAADGDFAYICELWEKLHVVNLTNPAQPVEEGSCDLAARPVDVAVSGNHALVADESGGLRIIDVGNPSAPFEAGSCENGPGRVMGLAVGEAHAYAATDKGGGLCIVDVGDPAEPTPIGACKTPGYAEEVDVRGGYAYVTDNSWGLRVIDVADPRSPHEVACCTVPAHDVVVDGGLAYVASFGLGLSVLDVSDPETPDVVGAVALPGHPLGVTKAGQYVYVAALEGGLRVVDVANPEAPVEAGFCNTTRAVDVVVRGDRAYVANAGSGVTPSALLVIDISVPSTPFEIGSCSLQGVAEGVAVEGDLAYVAAGYAGVRVVDLGTLSEVGYFDTPGHALNVVVGGARAYVADGDGGLVILATVPPAPEPPAVVPNPTCSGTYVSIHWQPVLGATGYRVYWEGSEVCDPGDTTSCVVPGVEGSYSVRACNQYGWGSSSRGSALAVEASPLVASIAPPGGCAPGEQMDIVGSGFWSDSTPSSLDSTQFYVVFQGEGAGDDVRVSPGSCLAWTDEQVRLVVPPDARSGPLLVHTRCGLSNSTVYWQDTPVELTMLSAVVGGDTVAIEWYGAAGPGVTFEVRRAAGSLDGEYALLASVRSDGDGLYRYVDVGVMPGRRFCYKVVVSETGAVGGPLCVDVPERAPSSYALVGAAPNPSRGGTSVFFEAPSSGGRVEIAIYDLGGRRIASMCDRSCSAGRHSLYWDGRTDRGDRAASGVYMCRMQAPDFDGAVKVVLLH